MGTPVRSLFDLQEKMTRLRERTEERERMPPEVAGLDGEFRAKEQAVADLRARVEAQTAERTEVDRQLAEAQEKLTKYQAQLMNVRTSKEYSAALNEIDAARKEVKGLEDRSLALSETLEKDGAELAEREAALPGERATFEEKIADWRAFQAKCDADVAALRTEIADLEKTLPRPLVSQFRQVFDRRGGLAVVRVTSPSCGGCNVRLRPALYQTIRLRSDREVFTCEGCKRILWFDPSAE